MKKKSKESKDKQEIQIKEIKTFSEVHDLKYYIEKFYNGHITASTYKGFYRLIKNVDLRNFFARYISPLITHHEENVDEKLKKALNKKKKVKKDNIITISRDIHNLGRVVNNNFPNMDHRNTTSTDKNASIGSRAKIVVKPYQFKFKHSPYNPRLIWGDRERFFLGKSEWFKMDVLKRINRDFVVQARGYDGFSFIPFKDQELFRKLLEETYNEYITLEKERVIGECEAKVIELLEKKAISYFRNFRNFTIQVPLSEFEYNEGKEYYSYRMDCFKHHELKHELSYNISIPYSSIIELFNKDIKKDYQAEIKSKWIDGYSKIYSLSEIFPGFKSSIVEVKIPSIYINRNSLLDTLTLVVEYSPYECIFKGRLAYRYSSQYESGKDIVVFHDAIKESLIQIISGIDTPFIDTFYTAFVYMFTEGNHYIQVKRDRIINEYIERKSDYFCSSFEKDRYSSGSRALLRFNQNNKTDWMWLASQFEKGVIDSAYCFYDSDETFSSKTYDINKYPVKIYLTAKPYNATRLKSLNWSSHPKYYLISLYALDTTKSIYRFKVMAAKYYEAIFFLWSYFTSNNYNKRQDFNQVLAHGIDFGIISFYKDESLKNITGIGYCDNRWSNEFG